MTEEQPKSNFTNWKVECKKNIYIHVHVESALLFIFIQGRPRGDGDDVIHFQTAL